MGLGLGLGLGSGSGSGSGSGLGWGLGLGWGPACASGPACWRAWPPGGATARQPGLYSDGCGPARVLRCSARSRAKERAWAAAMSPRGGDARARGPAVRSAGATVGARQRLRPRRGNTQVTRGVRRDQPAARRAASAAARQAGRARARPAAAADGAVARGGGGRTAIVALRHFGFSVSFFLRECNAWWCGEV